MKKMAKSKVSYTELSKAKVTDSRNIVISSCSKGGFTIAQQLVTVEAEDKTTLTFLKGAFHVDDLKGLYELRDAVNLAIKKTEDKQDDDDTWDE